MEKSVSSINKVIVNINEKGEFAPKFVVSKSMKFPISKILSIKKSPIYAVRKRTEYDCIIMGHRRLLVYESGEWHIKNTVVN